MVRYNIGDSIVFKTRKEEAYDFNLLDDNRLTDEERTVFRTCRWGDSAYWDALIRLDVPIKFYGKVIEIREGKYADNKPYREVICLLSNGRTIGFLEDKNKKDKKFRRVGILENLLFN